MRRCCLPTQNSTAGRTQVLVGVGVAYNASPHATYLWYTVKHESWVDIIPYAALRDNIPRDQDNLDSDALCDDFLGGMYKGLSEVQDRGMILWGEPWSEDG